MTGQMFFPTTTAQVTQLLAEYGADARLLAGGAALVPWLHSGAVSAAYLINLSRVAALQQLEVRDGTLLVGAMQRIRALESSPLVQAQLPLLAEACHTVGHLRIRNQATIGGNLIEGNYGTDLPAVLTVFDATALVVGPAGERTLSMPELLCAPGSTALQDDELLVSFSIPLETPQPRQCYLKFRSRAEKERPCVGVAALLQLDDDGNCRSLRLAVGAATALPQRLVQLETQALGRRLDAATIGELAAAYAAAIEPLSDLRGSAWYRREIIATYVRRALEQLTA
jgi:aerobic carbon-monoxide dehydrogenase medium subunit